ncbi:hypothetical protein IL306_010371 [Fusarium sp. DS 682]|nr:hypothetical protein IL306_010371 [Fusarium sp. DS 682]
MRRGNFAQFLPVLANKITFIVYAIVRGSLDPPVVFSSLAMLYLLRVPTNWLPVSLNLAADAVQSIKRIEDFLLAEEVQAQTVPDAGLVSTVKLSNASFKWESPPANEESESPKQKEKKNLLSRVVRRQREGDEKKGVKTLETKLSPIRDYVPFSLSNISFECQRGELVGSIGGASVRDNITFEKPFDQRLYSDVVRACALLPDFELLLHGDMTDIGERGITLSGGQKQCINTAREIYSDAGVVLLDDPLSAVDAHVGTHIFSEAIGTYEELITSCPAFASLVAVGGHQQKEADSADDGKKGDSVGLDNTTTKTEVLMQE